MLNLAARHIATVAVALFAVTGIAQAAAPAVGQPAPAFKLKDQDGKVHDLADYKGKWVALYFYPKDDTPGCTTQACGFRDNIFAFSKEGAVIVGISVDDVASHKEFAEKHGLPFALLADTTGQLSLVELADGAGQTGHCDPEVDPRSSPALIHDLPY